MIGNHCIVGLGENCAMLGGEGSVVGTLLFPRSLMGVARKVRGKKLHPSNILKYLVVVERNLC